MGTADGCGYNGQQKYTTGDVCRPCHSILSVLKPVFLPNSTDLLYLQLTQVPRSPDLAISVSMTTELITLPIAQVHRVKIT